MKKKKIGRKSTAACTPITPPPAREYRVGVLLPKEQVKEFAVHAHDFVLKNSEAIFYAYNSAGEKHFVAAFPSVLWVYIKIGGAAEEPAASPQAEQLLDGR